MNSPGYDSDDNCFPFDYDQMDDSMEYENEMSENNSSEDFNHAKLNVEETREFLNQYIQQICRLLDIPRMIARRLLINYSWDVDRVKSQFSSDSLGFMIREHLLPAKTTEISASDSPGIMATLSTIKRLGSATHPCLTTSHMPIDSLCTVCFTEPSLPEEPIHSHHHCVTDVTESLDSSEFAPSFEIKPRLYGLSCGHCFCPECWASYLSVNINDNIDCFNVKCMSHECDVIVPEDLLLTLVRDPKAKAKYLKCLFTQMVSTNPTLRFCPGPDCSMVMRAMEPIKARRIHCSSCQHEFCFNCSNIYHAPTSCSQLKQWLLECESSMPTAKYIATKTKPCPSCGVRIGKDGGCNHMKCSKCSFDFCWICLSGYFQHECSTYKDTTPDTDDMKRRAFYFDRWMNHNDSLKLEEQHRLKVIERINEKVMAGDGTWIDWQYLIAAADNLRRCRYTLKFSYPLAFLMKNADRKGLFEYLQAQLERKVEDLAWKIEHSELHDCAAVQSTIDVCEKHRMALLQEFID